MDIFNAFAANKDVEENGKEVEIGKNTFITVARSGNTMYSRLLSKLFEAHKHELDIKGPDAEFRSEQIMLEVLSKTILLGWRTVIPSADGDKSKDVSSDIVSFKGEVLPFSVANARRALEVKDFRTLVTKQSELFQNFRAVNEEEDVKKSATTSPGPSLGVVVSNS